MRRGGLERNTLSEKILEHSISSIRFVKNKMKEGERDNAKLRKKSVWLGACTLYDSK